MDSNVLENMVPTEEALEAVSDVPAKPSLDPYALVKTLYSYDQKKASKLWYKLHNVPGQIKTLGDVTYTVSEKGPWIKNR